MNIWIRKVMTTVSNLVIIKKEEKSEITTYKYISHKEKSSSNVLKCKENLFKSKCNKALKRKLKKYKLRRDGKEDQDVIDVSHTFQKNLKIKSPSNNNTIFNEGIDTTNYLFKMVRRTKSVVSTPSTDQLPLMKSNLEKINNELRETSSITNNDVSNLNSQEKKHTNAFKVLMDSRNKSIGSNSPGKERPVEEAEIGEVTEKKNIKAKRLLMLQKLAEAKGSLQNKEKEEYLEVSIKMKMKKRAERLTNMIVNNGSKTLQTGKSKLKNEKNLKADTSVPVIKEKTNNAVQVGSLQLINMFPGPEFEKEVTGLKENNVPDEDIAFLNKLSPSIKKKENMLCYFKKIEKESESNLQHVEHSVIKVKFTPKQKKRGRKKKLSLKLHEEKKSGTPGDLNDNKDMIPEIDEINTVIEIEDAPSPSEPKDINVKGETRKRKRRQIPDHYTQTVKDLVNKTEIVNTVDSSSGRPKRTIKKPLQYKDDFLLTSSSDEEYHIFTPKKKKPMEQKPASILASSNYDLKEKGLLKNNSQKTKKKSLKASTSDAITKKSLKLAPIFACKPQIDPAALEAKQKFLHSGVPDKLKTVANKQKATNNVDCGFPIVVHIQQTTCSTTKTSSISNYIDSSSEDELNASKSITKFKFTKDFLKHMSSTTISTTTLNAVADPTNDIRKTLQNIKKSYPKFPVYRTYNLLKSKSNGECGDCNYHELENSIEVINEMGDIQKNHLDKINWTDKYKPMSTNQILGNFETIKEVKKWLETWTVYDSKSKTNATTDSDSSDFHHSDTDSRDSMKTMDNLLILAGPTGCGKTSCIYAAAAQLAIKVIEVNASRKRNGKIMLQDLQEATQSHKVNRHGSSSTENTQNSQEAILSLVVNKEKKRGRPKKSKHCEIRQSSQASNSQENTRTGISLILIDDADIVFDQDDGFCSAISQLIQYSKRPVVLVTTSLNCPHLQRFLQCGKILIMKPLLPRMLGTWLDIMCLADSGICWPGVGAVLLDLFRGDMRKAINCLQFYTCTYLRDSIQSKELPQDYIGVDDENSCPSWADSESLEDRDIASYHKMPLIGLQNSIWKYFIERQAHLTHTRFPKELWKVWWNLPHLLNKCYEDSKCLIKKPDPKRKETNEIEEVSKVLDSFSMSDYFGKMRPDTSTNITSTPWYSSESDSVSEMEDTRYYNKAYEINDDISRTIVVESILKAQTNLQCNNENFIKPPGILLEREKDRLVSRHNEVTTHLNPSAVLDRRALSLDYWSSCRAICRSEKSKTDCNSKRNNRFCHYLKSLKITCKNDVLEKLGESLETREMNS